MPKTSATRSPTSSVTFGGGARSGLRLGRTVPSPPNLSAPSVSLNAPLLSDGGACGREDEVTGLDILVVTERKGCMKTNGHLDLIYALYT